MFYWICCSLFCYVQWQGEKQQDKELRPFTPPHNPLMDHCLSDSSKAPYPLPTPHAYLPHQYISSIKDYQGCTNRRLLLLDDYQPQLPVVSWA